MRTKLILLILLVFALVLVSCQNVNHVDGLSIGMTDSTSCDPGDRTTYDFATYDDLFASFSAIETDNVIQSEKGMWGLTYRVFVDEMSLGYTKIIVPYFDGVPMMLDYSDDDDNITLFTKGIADLPWIWYQGTYNGSYVRFRIAYPLIDIPQNYCASQALYSMDPDVANTHNFRKFGIFRNFRSIKNIYEKDISLRERETTAIVYEYKDYPYQRVGIYHKGWFIFIEAEPEVLTDAFWKSLSFQ